jgi:hypothetical protein
MICQIKGSFESGFHPHINPLLKFCFKNVHLESVRNADNKNGHHIYLHIIYEDNKYLRQS